MKFETFSNRVKIIFLITISFLFLTIGMFIGYLITSGMMQTTYLLMTIWFGATSTLLFHYLLWQNLPFLQKINLATANNYSVTLSLLVYIILFPIISFLTIVFLLIFVIALFILAIVILVNYISRHKNKEQATRY